MDEIWRPAPGYEETHEVSSQGRVRSLPRTIVSGNGVRRQWRGKILHGCVTSVGYLRVSLTKADSIPIAPMVLTAFVGPRPEGAVVMHLNNIRTDNRIENLQWGTQGENVAQSVRDRTHNNARKETCPRGHPYDTMNGTGRRCKRCHAANERRRKAASRGREL